MGAGTIYTSQPVPATPGSWYHVHLTASTSQTWQLVPSTPHSQYQPHLAADTVYTSQPVPVTPDSGTRPTWQLVPATPNRWYQLHLTAGSLSHPPGRECGLNIQLVQGRWYHCCSVTEAVLLREALHCNPTLAAISCNTTCWASCNGSCKAS